MKTMCLVDEEFLSKFERKNGQQKFSKKNQYIVGNSTQKSEKGKKGKRQGFTPLQNVRKDATF